MTIENGLTGSKMAPEDKAQGSFHRFPQLATEIRLQIWRHAVEALPGRIIPLRGIGSYTEKERTYAFVSTRPHPTLATINREARIAVLETLRPLFLPGTNQPLITVQLERDRLLLDPDFKHRYSYYGTPNLDSLTAALGVETCQAITTLAVEVHMIRWRWAEDFWEFAPRNRDATPVYGMFPNLETLVIVPLKRRCPAAEFHAGELEFVPRDSGKWWQRVETYVGVGEAMFRTYSRVERRWVSGVPGLKIEFMQLGLVGGEKGLDWDPVKRRLSWRLMTEEEREAKKAKAKVKVRRKEREEEEEMAKLARRIRIES